MQIVGSKVPVSMNMIVLFLFFFPYEYTSFLEIRLEYFRLLSWIYLGVTESLFYQNNYQLLQSYLSYQYKSDSSFEGSIVFRSLFPNTH